MKNKIKSTVMVLALFFALPLAAKPQLLLHPGIMIMMIAIIVVFLTQPAVTKEDLEKNQSSDRNSVWLILTASALSVICPILEWAYFGSPAANDGVRSAPFLTGLVVIISGIALRLWAISTLGKFFTSTVQVQQDQRVISSGPYACIRHPSYLGAYLASIGCAILLQAPIGIGVAAGCMGIAYYFRIRAEERTLAGALGTAYRDYQQHTWRLVPGVW